MRDIPSIAEYVIAHDSVKADQGGGDGGEDEDPSGETGGGEQVEEEVAQGLEGGDRQVAKQDPFPPVCVGKRTNLGAMSVESAHQADNGQGQPGLQELEVAQQVLRLVHRLLKPRVSTLQGCTVS